MMIQATVQHFASLLANVLQLEVEVVDNRLRRVAGTGDYQRDIGKIPKSNTLLLRQVLEGPRNVVIFDSRKNLLCQDCGQRETCRERGFVGVPVVLKQRAIGAISLVAVNNSQLTHLKTHTRMFIEYIRHVSKLLVENVAAINGHYKTETELICFLAEQMSEPVLFFDGKYQVAFKNNAACQALNINSEEPLAIAEIIDMNNNFDGINALTLCNHDRTQCWRVAGKWRQTPHGALLLLADSNAVTPPQTAIPEIKSLIGRAPAMVTLKRLIHRIAPSPSSVLIQGESGTGKEVVARAIHQLSPRKDRPFVAINCAAIPENLLESELFGYAKGAFTGAAPGGKKGLIQLAHQGTLFLDEIGDMPLALQARLLRAIECREVLPIGGSQPVSVDIRIVSATHQDLAARIEEGTFREDLFYRLNVVPLMLAPLRERREDITLLLNHFIQLHARRIGCATALITPQALEKLTQYGWPGNVRELSNLVEYLLNIVPPGARIGLPLLPPGIQLANGPAEMVRADPACADVSCEITVGGDNESVSLRRVERQMIAEAMDRLGNKKRVAEELGIGVATLYRKIKKYGLR